MIALSDYLHPEWTLDRFTAWKPVLSASQNGRKATMAAFNQMDQSVQDWSRNRVAKGKIGAMTASAFVLPVLSEAGCDEIMARADRWAWQENEEEAPAYRMRESIVASHDAEYDATLKTALTIAGAPWFLMTRGRMPTDWISLQLARYEADERQHGTLHVDRDSGYTCVISLNPESYQGGGTAIVDGLMGQCLLPKLDKGWGLFFDGKQTFHAGLPVTEGTRKLLVCWLDTKPEDVW